MPERESTSSRLRPPEGASRRPLRPYQQGALDGLCGVYAVTNSLALLCPELTHEACRRLFRIVLRGQVEASGVSVAYLWKGCGPRKLRRLLRLATEHVRAAHGLPVHATWPGANSKTLATLWCSLEAEVQAGHLVIVGLAGVHRHWTVIRRITPYTLWLADSDGLSLLRRSHCTLQLRADRHRLDPREIVVLSRSDLGWGVNPQPRTYARSPT
jgi:hypothetical protein